MHHPTDRIAHTTAFVTPVVEHWLEREIAQWVHPMKDRSDDPSHMFLVCMYRPYYLFHVCCIFCGAIKKKRKKKKSTANVWLHVHWTVRKMRDGDDLSQVLITSPTFPATSVDQAITQCTNIYQLFILG